MTTPAAPHKYLKVTAPVSAQAMQAYFTEKNIVYQVNYTQSTLRGLVFLTHLANLRMPFEIEFDTPITEEIYEEVMLAYINQRNVTSSGLLAQMAALLLLWVKGLDITAAPYELTVPLEFVRNFAIKHHRTIFKWVHFIDSSLVYAVASNPKLNAEQRPKDKCQIINDKDYVGHNVVNLYTVPHFTELYFGLGATYESLYFTHQFEDHMFAGQKLAHYFYNVNNFVGMAYESAAAGTLERDFPSPEHPKPNPGSE